jgi:hypothetical protein
MTEHEHLREQLAYYRDLSTAERRRLDAHVAGCAECRAAMSDFARQDAMLADLPELRPRAVWSPPWRAAPTPLGRRVLGRLGEGLVLAGVAAMLWMLALQVRYITQAGRAGQEAIPGALANEPGLTLPPTRIERPSPWVPALPWIGGALLVVGGLFVFSRQNPRLATAGGALAAVFLVSYIPPLSAIPNPVGVYWRLAGGYSYDPQLPFKNQFLIAGRPEAMLRPYLDQLIGEVGLSPLDPGQPLASYQILRVGLHPTHRDVALVTTRFVYADGSSRIYPVPLLEPQYGWHGLWLSGWREDGLERLRSQHLAFLNQPFATADSPIRIGPASALALHPAANRLDEVNPGHWLWTSVRVQRLVWSPDGSSFLAAMELDPGRRQLWRVPLDGGEPEQIAAGDIAEYGWSPDGRYVVFTQTDSRAAEVEPSHPYAIRVAEPGTRAAGRTLATGLASAQLPGLTDAGAWFFSRNGLWVAPYDGGTPGLVAVDLTAQAPAGAPRPSPDGQRVVFACGRATCLLRSAVQAGETTGELPVQRLEDLRMAQATWTADGHEVAVVDSDPNALSSVRLAILATDGRVVLSVPISPREATDPPQWTPDNQAVLVQTYPQDGRRLIAVDLTSQQVVDLSQEHWDAYYALSPDGGRVLMNNGRGGFWVADILRN